MRAGGRGEDAQTLFTMDGGYADRVPDGAQGHGTGAQGGGGDRAVGFLGL